MIIWYPETKGKSLEEMDGLFGKLLTDTESRGHVTKDADEEGEGVEAPPEACLPEPRSLTASSTATWFSEYWFPNLSKTISKYPPGVAFPALLVFPVLLMPGCDSWA